MQLNLGRKIRELRHRDGRTQENLAYACRRTFKLILKRIMSFFYLQIPTPLQQNPSTNPQVYFLS